MQTPEQNFLKISEAVFEATRQPEVQVSPATPALPPDPISALKFRASDVFDMVIAGSQLAFFVISSDLQTCSVCGQSGANMSEPEGHHPCCKVRRWWLAVDALKIGLEVTL
jgi:hypothetical protein